MKRIFYLLLLPLIFLGCAGMGSSEEQEKEKAIKEEIRRIESLMSNIDMNAKNMTRDTIERLDLSTQGAEFVSYRENGSVKKIEARIFAEMGQTSDIFYLENGEMIAARETLLKYNRPVFYDKAMAEENNDDEYFDIDKSETVRRKFLFKNGAPLDEHPQEKQLEVFMRFESAKEIVGK